MRVALALMLASGVAAACEPIPLVAIARSSQAAGYTPMEYAVDGDTGTRWHSQAGMPQSITFDAGAVVPVCGFVYVAWPGYAIVTGRLEVSIDNATWLPVWAGPMGGTVTIDVPAVGGRYARLTALESPAPTAGVGVAEFVLRAGGDACDACAGQVPTVSWSYPASTYGLIDGFRLMLDGQQVADLPCRYHLPSNLSPPTYRCPGLDVPLPLERYMFPNAGQRPLRVDVTAYRGALVSAPATLTAQVCRPCMWRVDLESREFAEGRCVCQ